MQKVTQELELEGVKAFSTAYRFTAYLCEPKAGRCFG